MMRAQTNHQVPLRVTATLLVVLCAACQGADDSVSDEQVRDYSGGFSESNGAHLNGVDSNGNGFNGNGFNGNGFNGNGFNGNGFNGNGFNGNGFNGNGFNGNGFNGNGFNGNGFNGGNWGSVGSIHSKRSSLVGLAFDTSDVSGVINNNSIKDMWTEDGEIKLKLKNGGILSGDELVGAFVAGKMENGLPVVMRFNEHETFTSLAGSTLHRYVIEFRAPGRIGFVCGKSQNDPIKALPLTGTWDYRSGVPGGGSKIPDPNLLTFACEGFALYKCVDFGYEPWSSVQGLNLTDHHQTCTRMIRADYCGNGEPHTIDGTLINLYDNINVQLDTENWPIEAEWDENGARCLSHWRIESMDEPLPCQFEKPAAQCGNPIDWNNSLIVTEAQ